MQAEQIQGLLGTVNFATQAAALDPDGVDVIDVDATIKKIAELTGAPIETVQSLQAIENLREAKNVIASEQM